MRDFLTQRLMSSPSLRRLAWRSSRRLYSIARGEEQLPDNFEINGEGYVQDCVVKALAAAAMPSFIEIGANQGDWSASLLARLPPQSHDPACAQLDLFEPAPALAGNLRKRLASIDKVGIARLHAAAVSDAQGTAKLAIMSDHGGTNSLSFDESTAKQAKEFVEVAKVTLNGFCVTENIAHVHLAKCDAEGHDLFVLRGASELLKAGRIDVFQFEYNHRWIYAHAFLKDVFDLIEGLPYRLARVQPRSIEVFDAWHPKLKRFFQSNYVLVRQFALPWITVHIGRFDEANTYASENSGGLHS